MTHADAWIVCCEHATRRVPAAWRALFRGQRAPLDSHRGWDPGAATLARALARRLDAPLFLGRATRLLVDLNRSLDHPRLFSELTRGLSAGERERLLAELWRPYRDAIEATVVRHLDAGRRVAHLSPHSFTPIWNGRERRVDVGLLHDPSRPRERALVEDLRARIRSREPGLRVFLNLPYRGYADGLTATLRARHPTPRYAGIEIEVNQALVARPARWRALVRTIVASVGELATS